LNPKQIIYAIICGAALFYLVSANAGGFAPFAGPSGRSNGTVGVAGGHYFFHK
jgi:hypothetical protein